MIAEIFIYTVLHLVYGSAGDVYLKGEPLTAAFPTKKLCEEQRDHSRAVAKLTEQLAALNGETMRYAFTECLPVKNPANE